MLYSTSVHFRFEAIFAVMATLVLWAIPLRSDDSNVAARSVYTIKDSNTATTVRLMKQVGDVTILGHDHNTVVVELLTGKEKSIISTDGVEFKLRRNELSIRIQSEWEDHDVRVLVPTTASLMLKAVDSDVSVTGVHGEIELSCVDGDVLLQDVLGPVVANSVDGDIQVNILDSKETKPVSLVTYDGDVQISLPAMFKATLKATTVDGSFETDFTISQEGNASAFNLSDSRSSVRGTINGGGSRLEIKTVDGDVEVLKRTP